ncbi:MAG: isoprenylcysteine carboxylmethyltransferase family protein [Planctomycetaceae bacterium]
MTTSPSLSAGDIAGGSQQPTITQLVARWLGTPLRRKLRFVRGPLRGWLVLIGLLTIQLDAARFAIGVLCVVLGTALHFVSKCYLRQDRQLTVSGPYRFTRNPFYLANLIFEGGLLVIIGNPWVAAAFLAAWFWIYGRTIRDEEATLLRLFGKAYADYCRHVPRLLVPGRYLPREKASGPQFSLRNANISQGREIQRSLRMLSYPLLFLAAGIVHESGLQSLWTANRDLALCTLAFLALNGVGFVVTRLLAHNAVTRPAVQTR